MPHPAKPREEEDGEAPPPAESERQNEDTDSDDDGDGEEPGTVPYPPKAPQGKRSSPRRRGGAKEGEDEDMEELEAELIRRAQTAVLDCIVERLEEKRRTDKGGYHRGYGKKLVDVLSPRHPWLTAGMVTTHLAKRRRQKRKRDDFGEEEGQKPRKRGRPSKKSPAAAESTPRKRGRPPKSDKAESSSAKKAAAKKGDEDAAAEKDDEKAAVEKEDEKAAAEKDDEKATAEKDGEEQEEKDGAGGEIKVAPAEEEDPGTTKVYGEDEGKAEEEEEAKPPKKPRNPGGRPRGSGTKHRPRGSRIMTAEEKYDKDKYKQARDYAALEYHKIRHTTDAKRLKKGVLDNIIAESKRRYGLPEDFKIAHSTILGRIKRGVLVARGTKSPMERVEEELVRVCNDRLKTMDRQLFAWEGVDLANSLVKKHGMEEEIREWKMRHSYVATQADGKTPVEEKACYMGKAYWNQFIKRHGHRLEVRKLGRVGPQTPMVKVEDRLVEMVNALGRPVRPSEGVRLALSLVEGTPLETELRDFKVRTLKNKSAENAKGELLGPGYWRAFYRRNKQSLLHMDEKREESAAADAVGDVAADAGGDFASGTGGDFASGTGGDLAAGAGGDFAAGDVGGIEASNLNQLSIAAEEAEPTAAVHVETHHLADAHAYVPHNAPAASAALGIAAARQDSAAAAAVEAYAAQTVINAASAGEGSNYVSPQQWYNPMQRML